MSRPLDGVDVFTIDQLDALRDQLSHDFAAFGQGTVLIIDEASDITPEHVQYLRALHIPAGEMLVGRSGDTPTSPSIYETRFPDPWAEVADRFYPPRTWLKRTPRRFITPKPARPRKNKAQRKARKIMRQSK